VYQESPSGNLLSFNDYEFARKISQNQNILYVAELDKKMTGKKINLEHRFNPEELKRQIDSAFAANHIEFQHEMAIIGPDNNIIYKTPGFDFSDATRETFTKTLFPHSTIFTNKYRLIIYFKDEERNLFKTLPDLAYSTIFFTFVLLIITVATIFLIFKQKRLSELKSLFVNNVSHELKTPIATIQLAAQMLTDESLPKDESKIREIASIIKKENERMRYNVEKILQTSVIERGRIKFNKKEVSAHELIEKVTQSFDLQLKQKNGLLIKNLNAKNDLIYVDEVHFSNVLVNLLENALKYNEGEPVIEIETENDNGHILIKVQDNGIGIPRKDLKRIFDQFYRVQRGDVHNYKGFGLGLNYVKKIVEEHNGKITVDSEVGQGSTFTIILPVLNKNQKTNENG
jgi:signal transduction histidine kinase